MDQYLPLDDLWAIELQAGGETACVYIDKTGCGQLDDRKRLERRRSAAASDQQTH
jgi:hypothetical protein